MVKQATAAGVGRLALEVVAAVVGPVQAVATVFPVTLPWAMMVVADVERSRAGWCGVEVTTGRYATGSWSLWMRRRMRSTELWKVDAPIAVVSAVVGVVEFVVLGMGVIASVVMLFSPVLHARGVDVQVGPWTAVSWPAAWGMAVTATFVLAVLTGALWCGSVTRDAAVRVFGVKDAAKLRRELEEVRGNRSRLVEAFDVERRRIERDLHDGAQQELVALSITLGLLEHSATSLPDAAGQRIRDLAERAHDQAQRSVVRLRDTVRGIHPQELTDHGVVGGVRAACERSGLQVKFTALGSDDRVPDVVAGAVYFSVSEALTNVARHAGVPAAEVSVEASHQQVLVTVVDQGCGMDRQGQGGSGLAGLRDRLEAVDGSLAVADTPGGGTTVVITVPLPNVEKQR